MDKILKIRSNHSQQKILYVAELKSAVSLAVLPITESLKIAVVTLIVPHLSLSITMDRKKIILLFSYNNVMKMELKFYK